MRAYFSWGSLGELSLYGASLSPDYAALQKLVREVLLLETFVVRDVSPSPPGPSGFPSSQITRWSIRVSLGLDAGVLRDQICTT